MQFTRAFPALGLALAFLFGRAVADQEQGANAKKKHHALHGVVVNVDRGGDGGTITVRIHHHKKKAAAVTAPDQVRRFRVTASTKFEKLIIQGKDKDDRQRKPSDFAAVRTGEHVLIVPAGKGSDEARAVVIVERRGKKI